MARSGSRSSANKGGPSVHDDRELEEEDQLEGMIAKYQGRTVSNWGAGPSTVSRANGSEGGRSGRQSRKQQRRSARELVGEGNEDDEDFDVSFQFDTTGDLSAAPSNPESKRLGGERTAKHDASHNSPSTDGLLLPENVLIESGKSADTGERKGDHAGDLTDKAERAGFVAESEREQRLEGEEEGALGDFITLDRNGGGQMRYWEAEEERERKAHETCPTCGERGHDKRSCPHELCLACGTLDDHSTRECAQGLTCFRCGERGHRLSECKQPRRVGGGRGWAGRECMRCGSVNHAETNCPSLWRLYYYNDPHELQTARNVRWTEYGRAQHKQRRTMDLPYRSDDELEDSEDANDGPDTPPHEWDPAERWCYNCALQGHWGDDCPQPRCNFSKPTGEPSAYSEHLARAGPYASRYAPPPPPQARNPLGARINHFRAGQDASMHIIDMPDEQHIGSRSFAKRKAKEETGIDHKLSRKDRVQKKLQEEQKAREEARKSLLSGEKRKRETAAQEGEAREAKERKKQRKADKLRKTVAQQQARREEKEEARQRAVERKEAHEQLMASQQEAKRERQKAAAKAKEEKAQKASEERLAKRIEDPKHGSRRRGKRDVQVAQ